MRKIILPLMILLILPTLVYGAVPIESNINELEQAFESGVDRQIDVLDMKEWEDFVRKLQQQDNSIIEDMSIKKTIKDLVTGNFTFSYKGILAKLSTLFFKELSMNLGWMSQIIVLAIICGILVNLQSSFENSSIATMAYYTCYAVVMILVINSFSSILNIGKQAIEQMIMFMQILFPPLLVLLVAMGGIASSAILQPAIALLVGTVGSFLKNTMLPLIYMAAILVLVNHISDKIQLKKLGKLIENLCKWTLGIVFTLFIGVLSIQGAMAASFDGLSIRTAKYAIDTFVPIVGGLFSKAVDTIIGCSLLVKNATGVVGLIIIAAICATPVIKILTLMVIYKLTGALLEPISDARIAGCINDIGGVITILFITVISIAIMFFMTITLLIGIGNITVMMR